MAGLERDVRISIIAAEPGQSGCRVNGGHICPAFQAVSYFPWPCRFQEIHIQQLETTRMETPCVQVLFFFFPWNDWRYFGREEWGCLVCTQASKSESASPRFVLLKALQLIPLLGQGRLQVQIGAVVRELQCAVIELWERIQRNKRLNGWSKQKVTPKQS